MIIKMSDKSKLKNEVPVMKIDPKKLIQDILEQNKYLIKSDIGIKRFSKLLTELRDVVMEDKIYNELIFCPSELINSYLLCSFLTHRLTIEKRVMRSSEIADVAFGKSELYKNINGIREMYLYVILDIQVSDYLQSTLIQLYETRVAKGLKTIIIVPSLMEMFGEYPILDGYYFPNGEEIIDGVILRDLYEIDKRLYSASKRKRGE